MPQDPVKILDIRSLSKDFEIKTGVFRKARVHALNAVSLTVLKGKTLSLVGESGCGKTTLGKVVLGLHQADAGQIFFNGREIAGLSPRQRRNVQKDLQMIFQDPFSSLNPRKKIVDILERPLKTFSKIDRKARRQRIEETCEAVGVDRSYLSRYPHQFSGGQRQRVAIARAIILDPALVVADEPISALDVSIQAQILNLMIDLQQKLGLTYLFITHDISVVQYISNQVAVMYLGQIVEWADKSILFDDPLHPYTKLLFSAVPDIHRPFLAEGAIIQGEIPNPTELPQGCFFEPRCPMRTTECRLGRQTLRDLGKMHFVRCMNV